jgi:hypothetical protein
MEGFLINTKSARRGALGLEDPRSKHDKTKQMNKRPLIIIIGCYNATKFKLGMKQGLEGQTRAQRQGRFWWDNSNTPNIVLKLSEEKLLEVGTSSSVVVRQKRGQTLT